MDLENRIRRSISQRADPVILRSDVASMGSASQVGKILSRLIDEGALVRVSKGAFAKARINKFTGKPTPVATLEEIAAVLFRKLKIKVAPSVATLEYNRGKTTQVPMGVVVNTGYRRIRRKITVGNRTVAYENNYSRN